MILDDLLLGDEEDKEQLIERTKAYVEGEGKSIYIQAYEQSKEDSVALQDYEEDEDTEDEPPEKIKGFPALHIYEKMMHQTDMLDVRTIPTKNEDFDMFSKKYSIQDLVMVITFLYVSVVQGKALVMPSCPKQSKAAEGGGLKIKRDVEIQVRVDAANKHRLATKGILAQVGDFRLVWEKVEDRLMTDYSFFYRQLNKRVKDDNGKMMLVFTQSRVDSFEKWKNNGVGNKKSSGGIKKRLLTIDEKDDKEKKRLKCLAISKGLLVDDEEDEDDDGWI